MSKSAANADSDTSGASRVRSRRRCHIISGGATDSHPASRWGRDSYSESNAASDVGQPTEVVSPRGRPDVRLPSASRGGRVGVAHNPYRSLSVLDLKYIVWRVPAGPWDPWSSSYPTRDVVRRASVEGCSRSPLAQEKQEREVSRSLDPGRVCIRTPTVLTLLPGEHSVAQHLVIRIPDDAASGARAILGGSRPAGGLMGPRMGHGSHPWGLPLPSIVHMPFRREEIRMG